jgi:hypothetical protein
MKHPITNDIVYLWLKKHSSIKISAILNWISPNDMNPKIYVKATYKAATIDSLVIDFILFESIKKLLVLLF